MARTDPESAPPASSGVSCSMESMRRRTEPPRMITSRFSGGVGARRSGMKTPPAWRNDDGTCSAFPASKQQAQATRNATTIGDFSANGSSRGRICVLSLSFFCLLSSLSAAGSRADLERWFGHDVLGESDVGRPARLERDGVESKVFQHVEDGLEPEVLHPTLALAADRQSQVLKHKNSPKSDRRIESRAELLKSVYAKKYFNA